MKKHIEELGGFISSEQNIKEDVEGSEGHLEEGTAYGAADLFSKGIMPDGEKWPKEKTKIFAMFAGDIAVENVKSKAGKKGTNFTFDVILKPGKGGGGGASIDPTTSNHWFNLAGTGRKQISEMKKAFLAAAKKSKSSLGASIHKWLADPNNWWWRVVGWDDRKNWSKPSAIINKVEVMKAMVDPKRRRWPSGRTEIWAPLKIKINAQAKRKMTEDTELDEARGKSKILAGNIAEGLQNAANALGQADDWLSSVERNGDKLQVAMKREGVELDRGEIRTGKNLKNVMISIDQGRDSVINDRKFLEGRENWFIELEENL